MKILIIYATAGAGHKRAAEAVFEGLRKDGRHDVQIIDSLDYTNPLFKRAYPWIYTFLITRLSWAWGFFFGMLDLPWMQPLVKGVRRLSHWINAQPLEEFVRGGKFDAIIVTQFLGAEVCSHLKRSPRFRDSSCIPSPRAR